MKSIPPSPEVASVNIQTEEYHLPALPAESEALETIFVRSRDGLVPADQLPPAAGVMAELFPPEEFAEPVRPVRSAEVSLLEAGESAGAEASEEFEAAIELGGDEGSERADGLEHLSTGMFGEEKSEGVSGELAPALEPAELEAASEVSESSGAAGVAHAAPVPGDTATPHDGKNGANGNSGKRSALSGVTAAAGGLLRSVLGVFGGASKQRAAAEGAAGTDASKAQASANSVEVKETAQEFELVALETPSHSSTLLAGSEHSAGHSDAPSPEIALEAAANDKAAGGSFVQASGVGTEECRTVPAQPSAEAISAESAIKKQDAFSEGETELVSQNSAVNKEEKQHGPATSASTEPPALPAKVSSPAAAEFSAFSAPEAAVEDENEIVDNVDDDAAIAAAIERYANLNDPDRARASEAAEMTGPETGHDKSAPQPDPPGADLNLNLNRDLNLDLDGDRNLDLNVDLNRALDIPRDILHDSALGKPFTGFAPPSVQIPDIEELLIASAAAAASSDLKQDSAGDAAKGAAATSSQDVLLTPPASAQAPAPASSNPRDWSFEEKLASHHEWIDSKGKSGRRVDFGAADLEGSDLIGANLRYMDLHDANLHAADLLMADLRDACLVRANFRDACLVGANLEAANLEGATLESAMGLVARQVAGANLHEASLPAQILQFEALPEFKRSSRTVYGYFVALMSMCVLSWLTIWMTKDFQIVTNASVIPFLHSQAAAVALPTQQFYLIAPFALFIVYLVFHFHLQHLWDLVLELPAVFPDGRALAENEPRVVVGLLRSHFRWMNNEVPSARVLEKAVSIFVAYWIVPATLLFYWVRYLTLQDFHGTIFQTLLVVGASGAALYSTTKVGKPAAHWTVQENTLERALGKLRAINPVTTSAVLLGMLIFVSAGTMLGVPHSKDRAPQFLAGSIRRWAPSTLWSVGIDPYADLTEAAISIKPANWNGSDSQLSAVKGARLNGANFRYAQAYRAFLANAHLLHANFQGAFLSQADLRGADLGQSNLRYATLDQALMSHASLDRATLDGANLSRSDMRGSNLSYATLGGATLVDARLDGATLYGAKLPSATMIRTNFEKADLREAHLENANLEHADMQGAYLWSAKLAGAHLNNAQLGTAIFVDTDLRGVDLRWAQLGGTVLTGADMTGALLDGADFRGAVGFGANQICAAKSRHGLLLDEAIQAEVTAHCGAGN